MPRTAPGDVAQIAFRRSGRLARGRVLASWPGHSLDAKHLYDGLIEAHPDDARPMLAKGLLLRQQGRGVDADRAFLQARALVLAVGERISRIAEPTDFEYYPIRDEEPDSGETASR